MPFRAALRAVCLVRLPAAWLAKRNAELLHLGSYELNESKTLRHAGAAPAPAVWKTAVLAVTPMTRKWWLRPVSRRTLLVFSEALIYLSYTANGPSARYRAAVSRLSGEGSAFELRRNEDGRPTR